MKFTSEPMTEEVAKEILNWRYSYPYDFYNNTVNDESMSEILDGTYLAVRNEERELFGFYCTGNSAQVPAGRISGVYPAGYIDFGLGMKPAETGHGLGSDFFAYIKREILGQQPEKPLRLTVATFNKRAIRLYEKFGFKKEAEFKTDFATFLTMLEKD
ncbi:GNAT family N-acetyltransferase [Planococcus halotolerans]|uniref:GNAT family N-acetyltransferase n=1 Tax=Planococcus halotolerans TaxID=2233542 RepID=UPI00109335CB|nr:GNAT family protein [Planococcus halotolerans]QHJ69874.1 GNAT family N-acetyltransferase [Planococcus halotolerans]